MLCVYTFVGLLASLSSCIVALQDRNSATYPTIYVDPSGRGNFTTIQAAINSVSSLRKTWTCIYIKKGVYKEKVRIPHDKTFIYLKGDGQQITYIIWGDHDDIGNGATFTSEADNTIGNGITFANSYNSPHSSTKHPMAKAVAAVIKGDKSAFYRCGFFSLQDTLWDHQGRHYFKLCTIEGAVDFIFGAGQSLYERCTISVIAGALNGVPGYITAQARSYAQETNGFVFNNCDIDGNGKAFLGRPWRDYARVLFYNTSMSNIIVPQGWDSWQRDGHEDKLSLGEINCRGLGSNTSRRVKWEKKFSKKELEELTEISFIDNQGWISRLAFNISA